MAADIALLVLGILLIVVGLAGCILPVIPGPPVSFVGLLVLRFTDFVEVSRIEQFNNILWITAFAAILVTVLDYIVPVWGTKKFGGSRYGTIGAAIGLVIGLFFAPLGLILGPFLGAVAGELIAGKDNRSSLRAGFGSLIGFLSGVVMKLIVSGVITYFFIKEIFIG
jgi:hypothetical protein